MKHRFATAVAAALCVAATAGCGLGEGDAAGTAELSVTRDYGSAEMASASDEVSESDTVVRLLERHADITTRYGGRFVQSIDGVAGGSDGGRRYDWFFYVNGIWSSLGAAEYDVHAGDRVWWDHRHWTDAMRVPAVVGSWPEPFAHGFEGELFPTAMGCAGSIGAACRQAARSLLSQADTVILDVNALVAPGRFLRLLVGPWAALRRDPVAALLDRGPDGSGVFARFAESQRGMRLLVLDETGSAVRELGPRAGLVAALRRGEEPPTWIVTGTDAMGVTAAVALLSEESLRNRYALAVEAGSGEVPAPLVGGSE